MATNTAASSTTHTGNGSTAAFSISFNYISTAEIDVTVAGTLKTLGTHYTISGATLTFTSGNIPANGAAIKFQRDTDISAKKVDFEDGSVLTEFDLDTNSDQVLFAQQEIIDKLGGIEEGATADQTAAEIRTLVESATDSNVFTDADHTKLNGIETAATADQTASEIRTLVESASDSNVFTDADHTKLNGIEANATADQTATEIRTLVESASDSNVFTDTDHTKLNGIEDNATADQTITEIKSLIAGSPLDASHLAANSVTTSEIADAELTTLAGMQSATASKLASSTALTSDLADLNQLDGMAKQTTITDDDTKFPTSGAVVDFVAAQIAPLGGLEVIATDAAFPNTQPSSGVVISISDAGGVAFNGSGTSTTARTVGGATVTINNAPSSLNNETLVAGVGLMVSSTGSGQIYNYHKILGKEDDIKQLSDDINDFNARYRVGSSNPTSALDAGDLFFNTSSSKLLVYNATNSAWEEAQSIGNFFISTLSPAFDGSTQDFTITNAPANVQQIILSINGVIQKPNSGTSTPSEGFALSGSTVKLAAAPPSGSDYFAIVLGSTVNIGTPSNNTVSTAIIQNGAVTGEKLATNLDLPDNNKIRFGTGNDLEIYHDGSNSIIDGSGTGNLVFQGSIINLKNGVGTENMVKATANGAVNLYYDGSKKLETQVYGITVSGDVFIPDNNRFVSGNSNDIQLYHSGIDSFLLHIGTGNLKLQTNSGSIELNSANENMIKAVPNGAVELYHDNSKKFETTSTGATVTGTVVADHPLGNRNMLLNGNMRIAQRLDGNDGGSKTLTAGNYRGVDLSVVRTSNSSNLTITHPAHGSLQELGLHNSLKVVAASANSSFVSNAYTSVVTHLEGNHIIPTCWGKSTAKTCTLSFYVRSNVTGTFSGSFGNSSNNRANAFEYTINSSDTWERKTITVTGDTTGTWNKDHNLGAKITWSLGHGSNFSTASSNVGTWAGAELMGTDSQVNFCAATNNFWEISGVQFELGSAATPIEHQPFSQTLRNCRRYYFKNKPYGENLYAVDTWNTGSGTMSQNKRGDGTNGAYDTHYWWPDGDMRTNPTITFYGSDGTVNKHRFEQVGVVNAEFVVPVDTLNSKTTGFFVRITVNSSHTSNAAFYTNSGDCFVRLSLDASSEF